MWPMFSLFGSANEAVKFTNLIKDIINIMKIHLVYIEQQ